MYAAARERLPPDLLKLVHAKMDIDARLALDIKPGRIREAFPELEGVLSRRRVCFTSGESPEGSLDPLEWWRQLQFATKIRGTDSFLVHRITWFAKLATGVLHYSVWPFPRIEKGGEHVMVYNPGCRRDGLARLYTHENCNVKVFAASGEVLRERTVVEHFADPAM